MKNIGKKILSSIEKISYSINAYIALILLPLFPKKNNIWLFGGHGGMLYTDNAQVFYEYILNEHEEVNAFWILSKNASVKHQVKGRTLIKGSIKAYLYFYQSKVVCFSDTLNSDIAPLSFILPIVNRYYENTLKVYLSHGSIAFKKMPTFTGKIGRLKKAVFASYDLAIASSELSQKGMIGYGIRPASIIIAGSARHDKLVSKPTNKRIILVAPTWRGWLYGLPSLTHSLFFKQYTQLLTSTRLLQYMKKHNITMHFYLHHMFHHYRKEFLATQNEYVRILSPDTNISHEIMAAELMITDYSSMSSDFYYLNKPILFFQFDREQFVSHTGSEIDLKNDIFGDVSLNIEELEQKVIELLETQEISQKQKEGEKYFIYYRDKDNCSRIYHSIIRYLQKKNNHV